jgi:hypothetical protein
MVVTIIHRSLVFYEGADLIVVAHEAQVQVAAFRQK